MKTNDFAAALAWNPKTLAGRLGALDLLAICGRCLGSGKFSFNSIDGDRCYGCNGRGKVTPKLTAALLATVKTRVAAGDLEPYLAACRARAEAQRAIAPLIARADEARKVIDDAYSIAYKADALGTNDDKAPVWHAQTMNIAIATGGSLYGATTPTDPRLMGMYEIEMALRFHGLDVMTAVAIMRERVAQLEALHDAWVAFTAPKAIAA